MRFVVIFSEKTPVLILIDYKNAIISFLLEELDKDLDTFPLNFCTVILLDS